MKKLLLASVVAFGIGGVASAADLPLKAPAIAPPTFTWTGCYVGGYVGGAWGRDVVLTDINEAGDVSSYPLGHSLIGGGTLGCNWQASPSPFVLGIEGEGGYLRLTGRGSEAFNRALFSETRIGDWYGMVTGRAGYASDRVLFYVKGGGAFVGVTNDIIPPMGAIGTVRRITGTWTGGGGIEWAFANNWSAKGEYMFLGLHDDNLVCTPGPSANFARPCWTHDLGGTHTVKIGINYRWGDAAPVVARY